MAKREFGRALVQVAATNFWRSKQCNVVVPDQSPYLILTAQELRRPENVIFISIGATELMPHALEAPKQGLADNLSTPRLHKTSLTP